MTKPAGLRRTIGHVGVYDGLAAGLDTTTGRWQTVCERHHEVCSHRTWRLALAYARQPWQWCEHCTVEQGR
jgi:hypothetical protein